MKSLAFGNILKSNTVSAIECLHYAMNLSTSVVINGCDSLERLQQGLQAGNLGFIDALKLFRRFVLDAGVGQHPGAVDDAANRGIQLLINCMASYGFTFPNVAVGPVENFTPVADVPEPALVKEAAEK